MGFEERGLNMQLSDTKDFANVIDIFEAMGTEPSAWRVLKIKTLLAATSCRGEA